MVQPADPEEKALNADQQATATQAGIEKALFDELTKGLNCAGQSLAALDKQEHLTLLAEAGSRIKTRPASSMPAGIPTGSPIAKKLRQLRNFLKKHDTLQEGN